MEKDELIAKGCILLILYSVLILFAALAVGFLFGAGFGFAVIAVWTFIMVGLVKKAMKDGMKK